MINKDVSMNKEWSELNRSMQAKLRKKRYLQ